MLDVKIEDDISSEESKVKSHHIEHQKTSEDESVTEHQNKTSDGGTHRANTGQGVNILEMKFNWKYYDYVKFTSIDENKERR